MAKCMDIFYNYEKSFSNPRRNSLTGETNSRMSEKYAKFCSTGSTTIFRNSRLTSSITNCRHLSGPRGVINVPVAPVARFRIADTRFSNNTHSSRKRTRNGRDCCRSTASRDANWAENTYSITWRAHIRNFLARRLNFVLLAWEVKCIPALEIYWIYGANTFYQSNAAQIVSRLKTICRNYLTDTRNAVKPYSTVNYQGELNENWDLTSGYYTLHASNYTK